jgi:isoaspartyl peptidase/L-asparaginase-like protein (Ntn-hydrolase superfamily)
VTAPIVLAVHGGAGRLPPALLEPAGRRAYEAAVGLALARGREILLAGGSALDAVTRAVVALEDEPLFNAGRGSVLCADGTVQCCASVMSGDTQEVGAVSGLRRTRNPVLAARALLGHHHGLLFGAAGDAYAEAAGLAMEPAGFFVTPFRRTQWERMRDAGQVVLDHDGEDESLHGTVGAVALDRAGRLAAATSTGGLVNQLPGRVGDTPIVGAGTWADASCAVSATGKGEAFARVAFARRVADLIELAGLDPEAAARRTLRDVERVGGSGGCLVACASGRVAIRFDTPHMPRGWVVGDGAPRVALVAGEDDPA